MSEKVWFTSDSHFWHHKVIEYQKRPFANALVMNEHMIKAWNDRVGVDDRVFHIGDFCFGTPEKWHSILNRLHGRIHLIRGNHDVKTLKRDPSLRDRFAFVKDYHEETMDGIPVVMCHFPILEWNRSQRGSFMLHGHSHGSQDHNNVGTRRLDVGVDSFGKATYGPRSWDEVRIHLVQFPAQPHHGEVEE